MKLYETEKIRNVALLSHGGAGKTSLAEALLYTSGVTNRLGRIEEGTTLSDYTADEVQRKISIKSALLYSPWREHKINLLDTPGYADFVGEVRSVLPVADGAIIVIDATSGVEVEVEKSKIAYRETIRSTAKVLQGKYKRQSGGRGQYGDVWIEVEPLPHGEDFQFVNKIVGGAIPGKYIPAVEKGVREAMKKGVLAGYPLTDMRVTLYDGSFHDVDSSDMAFHIAGSMALKKASLAAKPVLLEPIIEVEITVPDEYLGEIR